MDEHNITLTTNTNQVFFSNISNRKYYCSLKWVCKIEQKNKWTKFQLGLLLKNLHNRNTFNLVGRWKRIHFQHVLLMIQSITSLTSSHPVSSYTRLLIPWINLLILCWGYYYHSWAKAVPNSWMFWHFVVRAFTFRPR